MSTTTGHARLVVPKHIRFEREQTILWSVIAALLGSGFVAGWYFGLFEVNWHIGGYELFNLKPWWDGGAGLFHNASWVLYRHGLRDLLEPAFATMGVKTVMAKAKYWDRPCSRLRLFGTPPLIIALAIGLATFGVWLLDFSLPALWHYFHWTTITAPAWISHSSWQVIVLGIVIGLILHPLWGPVGAELQGRLVNRSVERKAPSEPLWVREPIAPPTMRKRWVASAAAFIPGSKSLEQNKWERWVLSFGLLACVLITLLGLLAQHWIGLGHTVPYLAP
jgi:hypothetical protein